MQQSIIEPPLAEPVALQEAKFHLRFDLSDEDALIAQLISNARRYVETATKRALIRQRHRATMTRFPRVFELPISPVRKVNSITYVDNDGETQTLSSSLYQVDLFTSDRAMIAPAYGQTWPSVRPETFNAVTIDYLAGYATPFSTDFNSDANALNAPAHPYQDDDIVVASNSGGQLPDGLDPTVVYHVVNSAANSLELALTQGGSPIALQNNGDGLNFIDQVPAELTQAVKLLVGHWFKHREVAMSGNVSEIPFTVDSLLGPYKSQRFA